MLEQRCIFLLKECKSLVGLMQIHGYTVKIGRDNDPLVLSKFLLSCAITFSGAMDYACRLFRTTPNPDSFMFNTLIRGFSELNMPQESIFTYNQMKEQQIMPDSFTFAFLLKSLVNFGCLDASEQVHCDCIKHGLDSHGFVGTTLIMSYASCAHLGKACQVFDEMLEPNVVSHNAMLSACLRCSDVEQARIIFDRMPWRNITTWNIMLDGYINANEFELAERLFDDMPQRDLVSWNTMMIGYVQSGNLNSTLELFKNLRSNGFKPNEVSITGILSACSQMGALETGKMIHGYIDKTGLSHVVIVNNSLIDLYGKCGNINMATLVFDRTMNKTIVSWTVMIEVLAMHGHGDKAIELFQKMLKSGIEPDSIAFLAVLYACSHAGLTQKGKEIFEMMIEMYVIEPSVEHYGCMVDLYGRAGLLNHAYEFIMCMPIEPNDVIWKTLLGACSIHGDVIIAEHAKKQLSLIDPQNHSDFILLSNIYAVAGKWHDVAAVRNSMLQKRIIKTPAWSIIEVDKEVYSVVAGDRLNPVAEIACQKLSEIMMKLKCEGYMIDVQPVLHDIELEDKEGSVSQHSEKLAVAFGIARLHEQSVIRIMKNLRVCRDCHTLMKFI